ncbi:hypothetical protein SLEP1_g16137 [Rubroshorea leprosula]|uniref:Pentatricopeptide repeat-containing protein n=1 Tax=Rubroshorea leprosula TaxID=152421 RepID=A0AAV5IPU2_9ROSI|nr:hypothetical protein SLEP1_g16137 [Rubroshorea leprosula]
MLVITANAGTSVFNFDRNGICAFYCTHKPFTRVSGFLISGAPNLAVRLNKKNEKKGLWMVGTSVLIYGTCNALSKRESDDRLVSGGGGGGGGGGSGVGILEEELEFQPAFDDYLKAMESIKSVEEKKHTLKWSRHKLKNESKGREASKGDKNMELKSRELLDEERRCKMEKCNEPNRKGAGANSREGRLNYSYKEKDVAESKDRLNVKHGSFNAKERWKPGGKRKGGRLSVNQTGTIESNIDDFNLIESTKVTNARESFEVLNGVSDESTYGVFEQGIEDPSEVFGKNEKASEGKKGLGDKHSHPVNGSFQLEKVGDGLMLQQGGKLARSRKTLLEGVNNSLDVERAAFKNFEESDDVVDKPRVSRKEMEERIQKLAKRLNAADVDMPEWSFSKMMRSARIRFSDHSILRVIQILGKLGNWRRVLQVIEWLQLRERFKSYRLRYIYTTALHVLGKARRPVEALNIFHTMQQQMSSYPDMVAYHSIAVTLGQAGHLKELFGVIDTMQSPPKKNFKSEVVGNWDPQLEPDIVVYNAVLNACAQRKQWEGAFWVLQHMKQRGQWPSTTTYGLIMEVMFACGKYNLVHEFFRKIQKSSVPNALAYRVLVNTLWKESKIDEAILAIQDMERRGIVGSAAIYYDLARCLCSAGRCQEALIQVEKICKVANKPLVVTYTGLIQACLDSGNIQNATYILNQMKDFCSPNLVTCNIMLKAYVEHGLFYEAKELFEKMSEDGNHINRRSDYKHRVLPDIYTFNVMLGACAQEKRWDDFVYIYGRMLNHGFHFNAKHHLQILLNATRAGKGELLETTWEHLTQANRIPPPALIKERFCMKLEKADYVSALSCIISLPLKELQVFSKSEWLNLFKSNSQRIGEDTILQLIEEANLIIARCDSPNPSLQNLLMSCEEFLTIQATVPRTILQCTR